MRAVIIIAALLCGCTDPRAFQCMDNTECQRDRSAGICEDVGYCSFPDVRVPVGQPVRRARP